jgi:hypothetical protein
MMSSSAFKQVMPDHANFEENHVSDARRTYDHLISVWQCSRSAFAVESHMFFGFFQFFLRQVVFSVDFYEDA